MVVWLYNLDQKKVFYNILYYNWSPYPPELRWLSSSGGCATMVVQLPKGTTRMATPKPFANWTRGSFKCLACWRRTLRSKHAQNTVTVLAIFATREHQISKKQSSLTYHIYANKNPMIKLCHFGLCGLTPSSRECIICQCSMQHMHYPCSNWLDPDLEDNIHIMHVYNIYSLFLNNHGSICWSLHHITALIPGCILLLLPAPCGTWWSRWSPQR